MNPQTTNILVVDDEPSNFDVIETFLFEQDYQLHYASSGKYALESLDSLQPDLILLDVMMPEIDGIEVCRRLKAMPQWANVPIIMVTALSSKEDLAKCLNAGADDFIGKPVNSFELRARVQSMLRIKRQYDEIKGLSNLQTRTIDLLQNSLQE
jgi:DNA-binding response OmpR family regulator